MYCRICGTLVNRPGQEAEEREKDVGGQHVRGDGNITAVEHSGPAVKRIGVQRDIISSAEATSGQKGVLQGVAKHKRARTIDSTFVSPGEYPRGRSEHLDGRRCRCRREHLEGGTHVSHDISAVERIHGTNR